MWLQIKARTFFYFIGFDQNPIPSNTSFVLIAGLALIITIIPTIRRLNHFYFIYFVNLLLLTIY